MEAKEKLTPIQRDMARWLCARGSATKERAYLKVEQLFLVRPQAASRVLRALERKGIAEQTPDGEWWCAERLRRAGAP